MDKLSGRVLGDFRLLEVLGEGGSSTVYLAEQRLLNRRAVVKVLRARLQSRDSAVARFEREAKLAARFDHPYAAHVYASGVEHDGLLWIAMELVQGTTLQAWLRANGRMPFEPFVPFFECVAKVVQAAHKRGIVHRDLKPANIMVMDDGTGVLTPKLLDFGIAKIIDDASQPGTALAVDPATGDPRLTGVSTALGSPPYMSPEQWDDPVGVRAPSDLYAMGVIAYEALTGRPPFVARSLSDYAELHRTAPVPPLGAEFGQGLDRFFARALAKLPGDRYRGATELAAVLRALRGPREYLQAQSQQWEDHGRPSRLLLRAPEIRQLDTCAPKVPLSERDGRFVAASRRGVVRKAWAVRAAGVLAMTAVFGAFAYRSALQAKTAERIAEVSAIVAAVEQGRQALLHGETAEARLHLGEAWRRGERSPATAFMLARAQQPRLAEQAAFAAVSGRMWSAAFSPDGRQIVTTDDAAAQVWDATSHQRLFTLPHADTVYQAAYTPDGTRLITASGDGAVRIWDARTGAPVRAMGNSGRRYFRLAVSRDGKLVAAVDGTGAVAHVWSTSTGAELAALPNDGTGFPAIAFSSDGHWLATTGGDVVNVFSTKTWKNVAPIAARGVRAVAFDPNGARLLTGAADGGASVWAVPGGARLRGLREVGESVDAVAFDPTGALIALATRDGAVQISDAATGAPRSHARSERGGAQALEFAPSSALVLTAGTDGTVIVTDVQQGIAVAELQGPTGAVVAAHWDPAGRRIVAASSDGTARIWDGAPAYRRWTAPPVAVGDCGLITGAETDRRFVAVGCRAQPTRVWDTERGVLLAELPAVTRVEGDYRSAWPAVSSAGDRAAIASGHAVVVYELLGGRELGAIHRIGHGASVNAVAFSPRGHDMVSGAVDGSLLVTRDGAEPVALPIAAAGIDTVALLADGRVVATDARGRLRIYSVATRSVLAEIELPSRTMALRPSTDGRQIVAIPTASSATAPVLVDVDAGRVTAALTGHVGRVFGARWAGTAILTAGADGFVRAWDVRTGRLVQTYGGGPRAMTDATLSPDGAMLVAGGVDGVLRFWDAATARPLWTLPAHKSYVIGISWIGDAIASRGYRGELSRWALPGR